MLQALQGITMVVTVLSEDEDGQLIKDLCEKHGIRHYWIKFRGANETLLTSKDSVEYLRKEYSEVNSILAQDEERCMVHCSAGLHRTGITGYSLMRLSGLNQADAYEAVGTMRKVTREDVGDHRIKIAEDYYVSYLLEQNGGQK